MQPSDFVLRMCIQTLLHRVASKWVFTSLLSCSSQEHVHDQIITNILQMFDSWSLFAFARGSDVWGACSCWDVFLFLFFFFSSCFLLLLLLLWWSLCVLHKQIRSWNYIPSTSTLETSAPAHPVLRVLMMFCILLILLIWMEGKPLHNDIIHWCQGPSVSESSVCSPLALSSPHRAGSEGF